MLVVSFSSVVFFMSLLYYATFLPSIVIKKCCLFILSIRIRFVVDRFSNNAIGLTSEYIFNSISVIINKHAIISNISR